MKMEVTQRDIENPQRFIGEGLGALEAVILEAKAGLADCIHCLCTKK